MSNLVETDTPTSNRENRTVPSSATRRLSSETSEALTRGVTQPASNADQSSRIHHSLHWLTYTVPYEVGHETAFLPHPALSFTGEVLPNHKGYDTTLGLTHGRVSFHTRYPRHKICVSFKGSELGRLVEENVPLEDLLKYALSLNGKITRLDFALDYFGPSSADDLHVAWRAKELRAPTRKFGKFLDEERTKAGDTIAYTTYIGSRNSARYVCCYDKGIKEGESSPRTRIELRTFKEWGQRLGKSMVASGIAEAGKQFIRDYIHCAIPWFVEATTGPSVQVQPLDDGDKSKPREWLMDMVLPILCRELEAEAYEGDHKLRDAYRAAVWPEIIPLRKAG